MTKKNNDALFNLKMINSQIHNQLGNTFDLTIF